MQDAYSLRCAPQVNGAARDALAHAERVAAAELESAIDNPMVLPDGRVESCGNFHGAPLGFACDFLAIAAAEVGAIAERRTDRLLDASRSHGLPPFLAADAGRRLRADDRPVHAGRDGRREPPARRAGERRLAADQRDAGGPRLDGLGRGAQAAHASSPTCARILAVELACAARGARPARAAAPAPGTGAALARCARAVAGPGPDRWLAPELAAAERAGRQPARLLDRGRGRRSGRWRERAAPVRAPRGTELSCQGWPQEAALRMLMNNLDPEVAERPDDLVVYGGTGPRGALVGGVRRDRARRCAGSSDDETLLVQSGKPVGVFRTHEWAPRVLIANSNLVPEWATWDEFRRLEDLGLTMYGQMTAGLVDLHRHARASCRAPTSASPRSRAGASAARSPGRSR